MVLMIAGGGVAETKYGQPLEAAKHKETDSALWLPGKKQKTLFDFNLVRHCTDF